jgi:hypothetical protein
MNKLERKKRKAAALRELAAMAEGKIHDMPPLKKLEDGPTQRANAEQFRRRAEEVEKE